jgi:hypothetical protein
VRDQPAGELVVLSLTMVIPSDPITVDPQSLIHGNGVLSSVDALIMSILPVGLTLNSKNLPAMRHRRARGGRRAMRHCLE